MALLLAPHVVGALLFLLASGPTLGQDDTEFEQRGQQLLHDNCSRCHAIERTGTSPHRSAPAFRTLGQRYSIDSLAEALAEGLSTGHPDMPEFIFEISEVGAILAYLQSIQVPPEMGDRNPVTK
jgi:mono/diheme cytochrome c family protein